MLPNGAIFHSVICWLGN